MIGCKGLNWLTSMTAVGLVVVSIGCGSTANDAAPYGSAVTSLEEHGDKIRAAFEAEKPEDAHDSLHEVGNILDRFPKLVESTRLTSADRDEAKQAADELFDAYTELDMSLHDGDQVTYAEVSEKIDTNLAILKGKVAAAGDSGEAIVTHEHEDEDHAHEGHDHGDHDDHDHAHDDHGHDDHAHDDEGGHEHDADAHPENEPAHP